VAQGRLRGSGTVIAGVGSDEGTLENVRNHWRGVEVVPVGRLNGDGVNLDIVGQTGCGDDDVDGEKVAGHGHINVAVATSGIARENILASATGGDVARNVGRVRGRIRSERR